MFSHLWHSYTTNIEHIPPHIQAQVRTFNLNPFPCYLVNYWNYNRRNNHLFKCYDLIATNGRRLVTDVTYGHMHRLAYSECSFEFYNMCNILGERELKWLYNEGIFIQLGQQICDRYGNGVWHSHKCGHGTRGNVHSHSVSTRTLVDKNHGSCRAFKLY